MFSSSAPAAKSTDVAWSLLNLETEAEKDSGRRFIKALCRYLPVYSPGAKQIYSDGECHFTTDNKVVFLANIQDYTKTYSNVSPDAVVETGIYIYRGRTSKSLLFLQRSAKTGKTKIYPLDKVLDLIINGIEEGKAPFIPVLQKSTIQMSHEHTPVIRLSSMKPNILSANDFSPFEVSMIKQHFKDMFVTMKTDLCD